MANKETNLESLSLDGRNLLSVPDTCNAHRDFIRWADKVAEWLDCEFPHTGWSAQWSGLPVSLLVVGNQYDSSHETRMHFNRVVSNRLTWIGKLGQKINDARSSNQRNDTSESDALFLSIIDLLKKSVLPQQFKSIVLCDILESQKAYQAESFKGCVVMLGAALEGVMLGTLQRSDVITFISTCPTVPGPLRRIGTRSPNLADKIGNDLSFEDYKQCIYELVPGSNTLGVDNIQDFRNAIHPWKTILEPLKYGTFDRPRALHYIASFKKIFDALHGWTP